MVSGFRTADVNPEEAILLGNSGKTRVGVIYLTGTQGLRAAKGDLLVTPASGRLGLSSIGQIGLTVQDLDRAVAFYREKLGMKMLFRMPHLAFFDCGGVRLMLSPGEQEEGNFSSIIYYRVDDIQASALALKEHGVVLEQEPHLIAKMPDHDLWMAFLRDTERNLLGLMCEVRPPAA